MRLHNFISNKSVFHTFTSGQLPKSSVSNKVKIQNSYLIAT